MAENTEYKPPRTLREKLTRERTELYQTREIIHKAITELLGGASVVSYTLANRCVSKTRADLICLKAYASALESRIDEIEAMLSGRPQRQKTVHTYISPANTIPPFLW